MPIKQSELKQKWYFRGAQVFFWFVQAMVLISAFYKEGSKDGFIVLDIILGFALYTLILFGIWKLFLFIAFGGVEKEMKKQ